MVLQTPELSNHSRRFSDDLALFAKTVNSEHVDLATISQFMGRRSIDALLLILALPMALPIPAPGISILCGVPLIVISAELLVGRRRAWLPTRLARQSISRSDFLTLVERTVPILRRLERFVRPRIVWLAGDWAMVPVGAVSLILAIIITLPVPLGHMLPGAAISVLALGLLERDGLVIGLGLAIAVIAFVVVAVASNGIVAWLSVYFG